jgi:hypothetical protein
VRPGYLCLARGTPLIFKTYRKALMKQFPYAVYYDWDGTTVTVHCVYHTARNPSGWQQRLP